MEPSYRYRAEVGRVVDGDTRIEARTYVEKRLAQNGNRMLVETGKRGNGAGGSRSLGWGCRGGSRDPL
ncbi:hypothetical protein M1N84_04955 [Dehalococcoidia bacterium]|nr:hypothetical protein [Dehalococcoidia bacterium]